MKKLHLISIMLIFLLIGNDLFSQLLNEVKITPPSYTSSRYDNLNTLLRSSLNYPASAMANDIQGTEVIRFSVLPTGQIDNLVVVNSLTREIDEEIIHLLRQTKGDWVPGTINGVPKTMVKEISVTFVLQSYNDMLKVAQKQLQYANFLRFHKNNPRKALPYYNKVISLFPSDMGALLARGYCLEELGYVEKAKENAARIHSIAAFEKSGLPAENSEIPEWIDLYADVIVTAN